MRFPSFPNPVVLAPLAGGPSTPELAAAVCNAGGFGFLAAGYKTADAVRADINRLRALTSRPFGLNVFVPSSAAVDEEAVRRYVASLESDAVRLGVTPGEPRVDDDGFESKLALAEELAPAVVSFTFGCPSAESVKRLQARGVGVWVTVTEVSEALTAEKAGADALVVQGLEAGGHRGSFTDEDGVGELGLLPLLAVVKKAVKLPLIAAGGIADGAGIAAVLAAGARAAQIGTAFLLCPEAGTSLAQRAALAKPGRTALTRAFTGRTARGLVNGFMRAHPDAPSAYPQLHHATAPLRAAARKANDPDGFNLWAGEAFALSEEAPAGELVKRWSEEAREALRAALVQLN